MADKERRKKGGRGRLWPQHKVEAVLESFKGEKSIAQICQERGIAQSTFFAWREQFLKGAEAYLANGGMSAGERAARAQIKQLERALAREALEKRIAQEALELLQDPTWRSRHGL